jgi:hypothetical protein
LGHHIYPLALNTFKALKTQFYYSIHGNKGKGKTVPKLTHHAIKMWGLEVKWHALTSAVDAVKWLASCSDYYTSRNHHIEGWEGSSASLDLDVKRKIPAPAGN